MTAVERWLRERLEGSPPHLLARMAGALPADSASIPDALAEGAIELYRQVLRGRCGREDALPLLAADALLTHAFEAQAELEPAGVPALAARWGAGGRLGELAS